MNCSILEKLEDALESSKQVGREIYYALSFLEYNHPARANLKQALNLLGINEPNDVELSNSVLEVKK